MRVVGAALVAALGLLGGLPAGAAPTQQTIVLNGRSLGHGQGIVGTFTASPPLCAAGRFEDGTGTPFGSGIRVRRVATCDDGSGSVTFEYSGVRENVDGPGTWRVLSATGSLARFRGVGTTSNESIEHDPATGAGWFVNTWTGRSDLDATAPSASIGGVTARVSASRVVVRGPFTAADNERANPVRFVASLWIRGLRVARRAGELRDGRGMIAFSVRRSRRLASVRLELVVSDPLLNQRTVNRLIRVRR